MKTKILLSTILFVLITDNRVIAWDGFLNGVSNFGSAARSAENFVKSGTGQAIFNIVGTLGNAAREKVDSNNREKKRREYFNENDFYINKNGNLCVFRNGRLMVGAKKLNFTGLLEDNIYTIGGKNFIYTTKEVYDDTVGHFKATDFKEGEYYYKDGNLYQFIGGELRPHNIDMSGLALGDNLEQPANDVVLSQDRNLQNKIPQDANTISSRDTSVINTIATPQTVLPTTSEKIQPVAILPEEKQEIAIVNKGIVPNLRQQEHPILSTSINEKDLLASNNERSIIQEQKNNEEQLITSAIISAINMAEFSTIIDFGKFDIEGVSDAMYNSIITQLTQLKLKRPKALTDIIVYSSNNKNKNLLNFRNFCSLIGINLHCITDLDVRNYIYNSFNSQRNINNGYINFTKYDINDLFEDEILYICSNLARFVRSYLSRQPQRKAQLVIRASSDKRDAKQKLNTIITFATKYKDKLSMSLKI